MNVRQVVFLILAICVFGRRAEADIVYVTSGTDLGTIDLNSGAITSIGSMSVELYGLGVGGGGELYGLGSDGNLYQVNTSTATLTFVGNFTGNFDGGAAFGAGRDGTLYATNGIGDLWSVDPNSGAATLVGNMGVTTNTNPSGGPGSSLYLTSSSSLYRVDPATANSTLIGTGSEGELFSLAYTNNTLYGIQAYGSEIWSLDTTNGSSTLVATYNTAAIGGFIDSIAVMTPASVPEPASVVTLGVGSLTLLCFARCRRRAEA